MKMALILLWKDLVLGVNLTSEGVRKFLKAYKTAKEDKLRAEERAMIKNNETFHVINIKDL